MSQISTINIDQQMALVGIDITNARMHISQSWLKMKVDNQPAKLHVERKDPSFTVNRKKINSESGLKGPSELAKDANAKSRNAALKSMSKAVQKGNYLGNVRQRGNRVAQYSRSKMLEASTSKKLTIGLMPKTVPEVNWDTGGVSIDWSRHKLSIDWEGDILPTITIDPKHSVEIYIRNKPYFRVTVEEAEVADRRGMALDEVI